MTKRKPSRPPSSLSTETEPGQTSEAIALTMIEANRRWAALQLEALETALAENTRHSKALLDQKSTPADAFSAWPSLYEDALRRQSELTRSGLELATQTFVQVNRLWGQLVSASFASLGGAATGSDNAQEEFVERRVAARIIKFPDRRKAAAMTGGQAGLLRKTA